MTQPTGFERRPGWYDYRAWYDHGRDDSSVVAVALFFALLLLGGIALWSYGDHRTAALSEDITTGQSTRPMLPTSHN